MFNFLKPKTVFEKSYTKLISLSVINSSKHYKPITAAYLYIVSDYFYLTQSKFHQRIESANNTFTLLENKYLSKDEMSIFDSCVELFGKIIRGEIQPRAIWNLTNRTFENPIVNLHICFGDLLSSPTYIWNYENAPLVILPIDDVISFATQFNDILDLTLSYIDELKRS